MPRLLAIPDIRARSGHTCGDVGVSATLGYYGMHQFRRTVADPVGGLSPDAVAVMLRAAGLTVLAGPMTVADLAHLTRTGRPVLCPVSLYGGHWVVVRGVSRGRVCYHDPATGPDSGKVADWLAVWSDACQRGTRYDRWGVCGWPAWMAGLA